MKTPLPLHAEDISVFARALSRELSGQLPDHVRTPGHLQLLNMLARSSGFRNFQHLRAQREALARLAESKPAPPPVDANRLRRLLRLFDGEGRLARWPSRRGLESVCLWVVWSRVPARRVFTEQELTVVLNATHTFGDHPLLRRGLCDCGLMTRTPDGSEYRRVEAQPSAEALALLELLRQRTV
ncbi:MAG: DUF2087 domain-containing protein [Humidesulfovibrio sp.]|nr:DUF2087 domain-containing protein [Humidesulfovibrio sp.]